MSDDQGERLGNDTTSAGSAQDEFVGAFPDTDNIAKRVAEQQAGVAGSSYPTGYAEPGEYSSTNGEVTLVITGEPEIVPAAEYYADAGTNVPVPGGNVITEDGAVIDTEEPDAPVAEPPVTTYTPDDVGETVDPAPVESEPAPVEQVTEDGGAGVPEGDSAPIDVPPAPPEEVVEQPPVFTGDVPPAPAPETPQEF